MIRAFFGRKVGWLGVVLLLCATSAASVYAQADTPPSTLDVIIPDYEVTTEDGMDYVEIPEGDIVAIIGKPMIPYYAVELDYPEGYVVQGVELVERSGLKTDTGLMIPDYTPMEAMPKGEEPGGDDDNGWFPELERDFDWMVDDNPDGSTTLFIAIFPFYYNSKTTEVRFYTDYSLRTDYILSTVEITKLEIDKEVCEPGETVTLDVTVENTGDVKDVLVSIVVKEGDTSEIVDGLPLRKLKGLQGEGSFSTQWDSTGFESGWYRVDIELKDDIGNVLDRGLKYLTLGTAWGVTTRFDAAPAHFDVGDEIDMSLSFENAGSVELSGTCLFRVENDSGEIIREFTHEFAELAPGDSIDFADTWDTSGGEEGSYRIVGIVFYGGQTTSPIMVAVSTNYFPTAAFDYSPESPDIGQDITFDASGSSDADGEIVSFEWDFGDGGIASEVEATHRYSQYGDYEVVLTVADNEGAIDTTWQFVSVAAPMIAGEHPRWDINEDMIVNYLDLAVLGAHYGETTESPLPRYDINCDGWVGLADCNMLVAHYGEEIRLETTE